MNQLYFTSCRQHRSLNGQSGFQVRAASAGFDPTRLRAATSYVGYKLPDDFPPAEDAVRRAPLRLALLDTPELGRVLVHSRYVGQEGQGTRGGNFFTHLVADLPPEFSSRDAAGLWGSPFWREADGDDIGVSLPEPVLPFGAKPADFDAADFVADPARRDTLQFLLDALLSPANAGRRIFLAAPPRDVAACVYIASLAMPSAHACALTFSTYESAPLTCRAAVVGADPDTELPEGCYSGTGLGYHHRRGKKSPLAGRSDYAAWVLNCAARGRLEDLARFAKCCDEHDVTGLNQLECAFFIAGKKPNKLAPEMVSLAFGNPKLAARMLNLPGVAQNLTRDQLELAAENADVCLALLEHPEAVEAVASLGREDGKFHLSVIPRVIRALDEADVERQVYAGLSEEARECLEDWKFLSEMERAAMIGEADLKRAGQGLARIPPDAKEARGREVIHSVAVALSNSDRDDLSQEVESALANLLPDRPQEVYAQLCEYFTTHLRRPAPLIALIAVGLGQAKSSSLARALGKTGLEHAASLVRAIKSAGKRGLISAIKNSSRRWRSKPKRALRQLLAGPLVLRVLSSLWFWAALAFGAAAAAAIYLHRNKVLLGS